MRDFSLASMQLLFGTLMLGFGGIFGSVAWYRSISSGAPATTGTVMIATLPILLGFQLVLGFLGFDMANEPKQTLQFGAPLWGSRRRAYAGRTPS
jgi:hypothetical protein